MPIINPPLLVGKVRAVALSTVDVTGPEGNVLTSAPQWHFAEGGEVETIVVCDKVFDMDVDEFTNVSLGVATCDEGAFFVYQLADIDQDTYDYTNPRLELYYSAKGSADVELLLSLDLAPYVSGQYVWEASLFATRDGTKVTCLSKFSSLKVRFFKTGNTWSASVYNVVGWPNWADGEKGWLNSDESQIFLVGGDSAGWYAFYRTSMGQDDGITSVGVEGATNPNTLFRFARTSETCFLTPYSMPVAGLYVSLKSGSTDFGDEPGPGIYYAPLSSPLVFEQRVDTPIYNAYSITDKQAIITTSPGLGSAVAFRGAFGFADPPTWFTTYPEPAVVMGVDDDGGGYERLKATVRSEVPVAVKYLYSSYEGVTINHVKLMMDGMDGEEFMDGAAFRLDTESGDLSFKGFWVGDASPGPGPGPGLYSEFFTDFVKSFEVGGYKP